MHPRRQPLPAPKGSCRTPALALVHPLRVPLTLSRLTARDTFREATARPVPTLLLVFGSTLQRQVPWQGPQPVHCGSPPSRTLWGHMSQFLTPVHSGALGGRTHGTSHQTISKVSAVTADGPPTFPEGPSMAPRPGPRAWLRSCHPACLPQGRSSPRGDMKAADGDQTQLAQHPAHREVTAGAGAGQPVTGTPHCGHIYNPVLGTAAAT